MKARAVLAVAVVTTHLAVDTVTAAGVDHFGPDGCVSLTRSLAGSCIITTNCQGKNTNNVVFAFDCVSKTGTVVRHSFGTGGFDEDEEYDTDIKCGECRSPTLPTDVHTPVRVVRSPQTKKASMPATPSLLIAKRSGGSNQIQGAMATTAATTDAARKGEASSESPLFSMHGVVRYGPENCIQTYRQHGYCVIKTQCSGVDLSNYNVGMVCVDKLGVPVRHLYGVNSFDTDEIFDTLLPCDTCLGLDDMPGNVALNGQILSLSKEIRGLEAMMRNISLNVGMLNQKVFGSQKVTAASGALIHVKDARNQAQAHGGNVGRTTEEKLDPTTRTVESTGRNLKHRIHAHKKHQELEVAADVSTRQDVSSSDLRGDSERDATAQANEDENVLATEDGEARADENHIVQTTRGGEEGDDGEQSEGEDDGEESSDE